MDTNLMNLREYEVIEPKEGPVYMFCKRAMDIIGSLAGLILLSPLLLIIEIAIKIEDPKGSIFLLSKDVEKIINYSQCINSEVW